MRKGEATRGRMIQATGELLQRQGYHATGVSEIIAASGAPRGSLYFHFPGGKEELACAALGDAGAAWRDRIDAVVEGAGDPGAAIVAVCRELADELAGSDYANGCPIATVALEAATSSATVRETCAEQYRMWQAIIERRLVGLGMPAVLAADLATMVLSAVEGAMLLARVQRSREPLERVGRTLAAMVPAASPRRS